MFREFWTVFEEFGNKLAVLGMWTHLCFECCCLYSLCSHYVGDCILRDCGRDVRKHFGIIVEV